jgi:hypothetical protein
MNVLMKILRINMKVMSLLGGMSNAAAEIHYGINDSFHEENEEIRGSAQALCSIQCKNFLCMSSWHLRRKRRKGSCDYGWISETEMLVSLWCCGEGEGHANRGWLKKLSFIMTQGIPISKLSICPTPPHHTSSRSTRGSFIRQNSPHLPQYTGWKQEDVSCQWMLRIVQHYWQHS